MCVYPLSGDQIASSLLALLVVQGLNPQTVSETQHSLGEKGLFPKLWLDFFTTCSVTLGGPAHWGVFKT